jgi:hypothetical protein
MDQEKAESSLNKLLPNVLPKHITGIAFDVHHTAPKVFTLYALFGVSDDYWESLDHINRAALLHDTKMKLKEKARSYANINIVFDKDNTRMIKQSDFDR